MKAASAPSQLFVFGSKPMQLAVQKTYKIKVNPKNVCTSFPLIFEIPPNAYYIDFSRTRISLELEIVKKDGTAFAQADGKVSTVNNISSSFFQQLKFYANGSPIYDSMDAYPWKAYIESVLFQPEEAKKTIMTSSLYFEDSPGDNCEPTDDNKGFQKRYNITKNGKFNALGPIYSDLFSNGLFFPNFVKYTIEMYKGPDKFFLMSTGSKEAELKLHKAQLIVQVVECAPSFTLAYERALAKTTAKFPFRKVSLSQKICVS